MCWVRNAAIAAASLLSAGALPANAWAAIVVASSGPSAAQYPAGRKLDDAGRITLKAGDSVTVLDQRGTKVLRGPGRVSVSQPGKPLPNPALAALTRRDAASRARTGAVRTGEDGKALSPNLWLVDVARPGTTCIVDVASIGFWRADAGQAARYRLTSPSGAGASIAFAAGGANASWDAGKAPVADGAGYTLSREGGGTASEVRFAVLPDVPADAEDLAALLIEKGCLAQLELLSTTLATPRF